jgi:ABC-type thiamin/hydroxymethylpyrimidine transport system permease subunit
MKLLSFLVLLGNGIFLCRIIIELIQNGVLATSEGHPLELLTTMVLLIWLACGALIAMKEWLR